MSIWPMRLGLALSLLVFLGVWACGGGDGNGGPTDPGPTPTISIGVSPATLTLDQGTASSEQPAPTTGTVTVNLTRGGGYTGSATVSVQGAPTGVSVPSITIPSGSTSGSLTVEVASTANPGTTTLTVRASGSGVSDATATFSLTVVERPQPGFSIAMDPASVSLEQGKSTATTVNVTRVHGFTGTVDLAPSGQPAGLTISLNPSSVSGDASQVQVAAGVAVAPGTYSVTVTGSAAGLPDATASLSVEVTPGSGGGEQVTVTYCDASGIPSWFAVKDGDGPWMPVAPSSPVFGAPTKAAAATYQFQVTSDKAGIATVFENSGSASINIFYASRDEIGFQGDNHCPGTGITKSATGTVAGLAVTDQAYVSIGGPSANVPGTGPFNFAVTDIPDGPVDLVASQNALNLSGGALVATPLKVIIRRSQNNPDGHVYPVLDFGGAEAFAPDIHTLTVNNLGTESAVVSNVFRTANGGSNLFFADFQPLTTPTRMVPSVPAGQLVSGDFHSMAVVSVDTNIQTLDKQRSASVVYTQGADQTVTLGPDLNMPTITWPSINPYVMFRAQLVQQLEYDRYIFANFAQSGGRQNSVTMGATAAYLGGMDFDLTLPNFSGLAGFDPNWGPEWGVNTIWNVFAADWTGAGGVTGNPFEDGAVSLSASRFGEITP